MTTWQLSLARWSLAVGCCLLLGACVASCTVRSEQPTAPPALTQNATAPAAGKAQSLETRASPAVVTPEPIQAETPSATATVVDPVCVALKAHDPLTEASFDAYPEQIQYFLNAGAAPAELAQRLSELGVANQPLAVMEADMSGDGKTDVAVSLFDPASTLTPPAGVLLVYTCQREAFGLVVYQPTQPGAGGPHLYTLQDLNADGLADLVDSEATCAADVCYETLRVWSWDGAGVTNQLSAETADLPYPLVTIETDAARWADGRKAIVVSGATGGTLDAGPWRPVSRWLAYDETSQGWRQIEERLGVSNFRIHVLHDAEAAARAGNFADALLLYQRVVSDDSLKDWREPRLERASLSAYARYKMVVLYTLTGQPDFAAVILETQKTETWAQDPLYGFVTMAMAFQEGYGQGGTAQGCAAAQALAAGEASGILALLGSQTFGDAVYDILPVDVCPWE